MQDTTAAAQMADLFDPLSELDRTVSADVFLCWDRMGHERLICEHGTKCLADIGNGAVLTVRETDFPTG
jgi:hypothetical protein